jgi:DNA-binding CsgD family transcriptional regulator
VLDFATVGLDWNVDYEGTWEDWCDEVVRLFVARDEPIPPHPRFMCDPTRVSDVLTYREQRANELLQSLRRLCVDDAVWLWLPAPDEGVLRRISFGSEKRGGIADREVRILELLTPHLVQMYRRAAARRAAPADTYGLTPREYEIVSLVAEGMANVQIAQRLWVSPHTVRKHLENAFEKLGVSNRTAAAARVLGAPGQRVNGR